jgi:hypothetical protein
MSIKKTIKCSLVLMITRNGKEERHVEFELGTNEYGGQYNILNGDTQSQIIDEVIEFLDAEYIIKEKTMHVWAEVDDDE